MHFVGRDCPDDEARYALLAGILREGRLVAAPPHADEGEAFAVPVVCFADVPVSELELHMGKYERFGLAFAKATLVARGANPVFYNATARREGLEALLEATRALPEDAGAALRRDVFAYVKFFDPALTDEHPRNFYMEREWRVVGDVPFALDEVRRVVVPEKYAPRLRKDVPEFFGQLSFSESPAGY